MEGYNNNEFHGYGGNTASDGVDRDFDEPLNWKYPALQDLEWEGTLISLPPKLTSLSDNFAPNVLPLSETTATPVPPLLPPVENVTNVPPNPQDQLPALQNINGGNNTDDYRQTQFRVSTANQVAPLLHAEVELPCSPQDQMPALQNINSRNNTDDYRQTQFHVSTANHVAPMLPTEVEFSGSQINHSLSRKGNSSKSNDCRRWTEEEHRLFLGGLEKYGKSDWINISRFIKTKTPTQVASHAQKYFIRQAQASTSKGNKGKRRSIHDIVLPDNGPVPHRIYQQNGVSFPTLDGPIPHHIHHQNGVPFPNPTRQQLYETHLAVFRYMIQQNWFLDQLKQIYQK